MSGSITPVFHQEMLNYRLTPSFEYQVLPLPASLRYAFDVLVCVMLRACLNSD